MKKLALVLAASALVSAGACGGKSKSASRSTTSSTAASSADVTTSTGVGATITTAKGGKSGAAATTTSNLTHTAGGGTVPASATVKPPAAGGYTFDNTGSSSIGSVPPTSKYTVSPPQGARQQSVRDDRDSQGSGTVTTQVLEYRSDGIFLVSLKIDNSQGPSFNFVPPAPVLFAPLPATQGRTWTVDLTTSDGCYRAHVDAGYTAIGVTVTAGGGQQVTDQVDTTQHITTLKNSCGTQLDLTAKQTLWYSEKYRLPMKEHTVTDGTANVGFPVKIHSDVTSTLRSTTPS